GVDQLSNVVSDSFGRMRFAAISRRDRRGKEIFQLEDAAARGHVLVGCYTRHCRLVHPNGFSNSLEIKWLEVGDTELQKPILLADNCRRDFQNGLGSLVERAHEPARGL